MKRTTRAFSFALLLPFAACGGGGSDSGADASLETPDADPEAPDGAVASSVPADSEALFSFLRDSGYQDFPAEPSVHPSSGPHGDVRVFFTPELVESLQAGSGPHPVGSAAIKELYSESTLTGWAVMVKTSSEGSGQSWYWYENFSTTDGSNPVADGNGVSSCTGCHQGGQDYVVSAAP